VAAFDQAAGPDKHAPAPKAQELEGDAQALVARLPALLVEASRVALTVAQGVHGRRRPGPGETFWQFRNFEAGDSSMLIDWRRSANASHYYVREREWEAAHTVWLWPDVSASMGFRSGLAHHSKAECALVLAMALGGLMTQAGERTAFAGAMAPTSSRRAIPKLAENFARAPLNFAGLPKPGLRLGRHSEFVIFSDFLDDLEEMQANMARIAGLGVRGHLLHIIDPAEETFPFSGRVRFLETEGEETYIAERAEALRAAYASRMEAHKRALAAAARRLGWSYFTHHSDRSAAETLLALTSHLSGLDKGYRAPKPPGISSPHGADQYLQ
jgi:uncharacterized protein (DUF58 family)